MEEIYTILVVKSIIPVTFVDISLSAFHELLHVFEWFAQKINIRKSNRKKSIAFCVTLFHFRIKVYKNINKKNVEKFLFRIIESRSTGKLLVGSLPFLFPLLLFFFSKKNVFCVMYLFVGFFSHIQWKHRRRSPAWI